MQHTAVEKWLTMIDHAHENWSLFRIGASCRTHESIRSNLRQGKLDPDQLGWVECSLALHAASSGTPWRSPKAATGAAAATAAAALSPTASGGFQAVVGIEVRLLAFSCQPCFLTCKCLEGNNGVDVRTVASQNLPMHTRAFHLPRNVISAQGLLRLTLTSLQRHAPL